MQGKERKVKLYAFSGTRHAHDVDFRRARVKNEIAAIERGEKTVSDETYDRLLALEDQLDDLIGYMHDGIVWLDGKRWELAQDCVLWAACMRGAR